MPEQNKPSAETEEKKEINLKAEFLSWVEVIAVAIGLALIIDFFIIINATIPSGSMEKTIMTGDRVLGTRFSYWFSEPKRGDIVVFRYPIDEALGKRTRFIKRIIGLPGETVTIEDGVTYINGEPLEENYINGEWVVANDGFEFHVPEGKYLMLGDNRNDSSDARYWPSIAKQKGITSDPEELEAFRYVAREKILGKAYFAYWPFSEFGSLYAEGRGQS